MRVVMRDGPTGVEDAFVELPHAIYAEDPLWIPEEEVGVRRAFSDTNRWFERGRAVTFCAPGRARLAVFRAADCCVGGRPAAFFGYLESVDEESAALKLLALAAEWARSAGADVLYGPIDFDTFGRYRLRTSAELSGGMPFPGEPYNRPYYPALLESAGFAPVRHYLSQLSRGQLRHSEEKRAAADALLASGYAIEPLDGARWVALLPELHRKADEIFADAFAYTPVPFDRFAAMHGDVVGRRLCPHTSVLARARDGDLAGFLLVFPHYGPLIVQRSTLGRVPASAISYDEHAPMLAAAGERIGIVKTVGIAAAHRRRGLMDALVAATLECGRDRYDRWIGALIRADNPSRRFGDRQERSERTYTLYAKPLNSGHSPGEKP